MRLEDRAWVERTLEAHPELGEVVVGLVRQAIVSREDIPPEEATAFRDKWAWLDLPEDAHVGRVNWSFIRQEIEKVLGGEKR
jgi:hypothetical protein